MVKQLRQKTALKRLKAAIQEKQSRLDRGNGPANGKPLLSVKHAAPPIKTNDLRSPSVTSTPERTTPQSLLSLQAPQQPRMNDRKSLESSRLPRPVISNDGSVHVKATSARRRSSVVRNPDLFGGIAKLRSALQQDLTFVAIDTESERQGVLQHVVELGVTLLRTRDIAGVEPGPYAQNWVSHLQHHHIVIDVTRNPRTRMRTSLFGKSLFLSPSEAKSAFLGLFQATNSTQREQGIALIGHSIESDLSAMLRSPGLRLDIFDTKVHMAAIFDTLDLGHEAIACGAFIPSLKLAQLVHFLGIDPKHHDPRDLWSLAGAHNASNDAAYCMIGALLFVTKWDELTKGHSLEGFRQLNEKLAARTILAGKGEIGEVFGINATSYQKGRRRIRETKKAMRQVRKVVRQKVCDAEDEYNRVRRTTVAADSGGSMTWLQWFGGMVKRTLGLRT